MVSRMDIIGQNGNDGLHYEETEMKNLDNRNNEPLFNFDSYRMFVEIDRELRKKRAQIFAGATYGICCSSWV